MGPRQFTAGALYYLSRAEFEVLEKANPGKIEIQRTGNNPQQRDKMIHCWRT